MWALEWVKAEKEEMRGQEGNRDGSLLFPFVSSCLSSSFCTMAYSQKHSGIFINVFIHLSDIYCGRQWS